MAVVEVNGTGGTDTVSLKAALSSSSTSLRLAQLRSLAEHLKNKEIKEELYPTLLRLFFKTYAFYHDRSSRRAVQECIRLIFSAGAKPDTLDAFVDNLKKEASKAAIAPSNAFVLVEWFSILIQECVGTDYWARWSANIILSDAKVLGLCQGPSSKPSIKQSALVVTRRAVRKLLSHKVSAKSNIATLVESLTAKGTASGSDNSVMLGLIAGVCCRKPEWKTTLENNRSHVYLFYTRELLGSRTAVPEHVASGLHDFFVNYTTEEEFDRQIVPTLEKSLLRAPEVLLDGLVSPLFSSLSDQIDLSRALRNSLLKPLLSSLKSSNAVIRQGASSALKSAFRHCRDESSVEIIADEILGPVKSGKLSSADHRALYAEVISALPISETLARRALPILATISGKESNESALHTEVATLSCYTSWCLERDMLPEKTVLDAFVKGLTDKKIPHRRIWALQVGEVMWARRESVRSESNFVAFANAVIPPLLISWNEVLSNPISAAQSGLITTAFILNALTPAFLGYKTDGLPIFLNLEKAQIISSSLVVEPKISFLLNIRGYGKLSAGDDLKWFNRALLEISGEIIPKGLTSTVALFWSQAVIFSICSNFSDTRIRPECISSLSRAYINRPREISTLIIQGIWQWIGQLETGEKDCAAALSKTENRNLPLVLRAICLPPEEASQLGVVTNQQQEEQMASMLVVANSKHMPHINWIDLCLRVGIDPGDLARTRGDFLIGEILKYTSFDQGDSIMRSTSAKEAAFISSAQLAFVAPEVMIPRILQLLKRNLDSTQLKDIGPTEAAIFRTPAGTPFVDVLTKKSQSTVPNKNTKDYDILRWEEELRAQIAQKTGQQQKLTPEETAKVNTQLKKETEIRLQVQIVVAQLLRGIGIIRSLATGPPTETQLWLGSAVQLLLDLIVAGSSLITGDATATTYLLLSGMVTNRVGSLRQFIGVATLRALEVTTLPQAFSQEPVGDLVTRVLYRLRFTGEQRPFDVVSLTYIYPLIFLVLRQGGFGEVEDRDSQIVLALELVSLHTDSCIDEHLPRSELLSSLIFSMQTYTQHYKMIRDCLADMCRCIAPNISSDEIRILAQGAIVPQVSVRSSVLQAISAEIDMSETSDSAEIWLACHDDVAENRDVGNEIWEESEFQITTVLLYGMLPYLENTDKQLRRAAARSLAAAIKVYPSRLEDVLARLEQSYLELSKPKVQHLDEYGMPKKIDMSDPWEARNGLALAFHELSVVFTEDFLDPFLGFLIEQGPLGDKNSSVRDEMVEAATSIISLHGKNQVETLMATFERALEAPDRGSDFGDRVNEAVIILYGALAQHLNPGDARVPKVIERLLATLSTPSETVQYAVAECLPPLVRASTANIPRYLQETIEQLFSGKTYAARRGAAYGLAGLISGKGILALKDFRVMATLKSGIENKKDVKQREGALLAYELLSTILGRIFEPYVIHIVPQLLSSFGDSSADVRDACLAAAKSCFASLSSYGVKQILPTLLEGLDDQQWRSKKGACDLLGAMAYLDPQQLAQSLPDIIPPLTGVLNDSHKEVRLAANRSLKRFGEVISNPEIKSLVDILLKALSDPTKYTDDALDALIKVSFIHYLDAPSLALVVRILERGLADRSSTKRKSAQVIGSLAHLTERKDLVAHLPILVAGLKLAVVDPVPTTRATASKALGSLVEKLGEDSLPDLIPGLMHTLKSDTGAGDRLGSAQALSEVLAGLGTGRLEETLPTILQNVASSKTSIREGFMSLFIFLPVCFGNSFANYLGKIIPPILSGLADDIESIRETSLRAGRLLVKNFATRAIDLLLPELERGVADDSYRIRLSSVELVGDLLFNLTGVSTNSAEQEEVEEGAHEAGVSLLEVLGEDKRNKVLSSLYICRCDTSGLVRSAAIGVWKALVASPRTLKELIPTLTQMIIRRLGSSNMEQKVIAGNALGELIRKAGDGVLSSLLPTLEEGLQSSTDTDAKQGICIALRELISSASVEALEEHEKTLISVVRAALTDSNEEVRDAAAEAFDSLQHIFGKRAVDQVLPYLLNLLRTEGEADNALSALLTLLTETTRSNIILPNLIPTLIASPINSFNAKALASLSTVAGSAMTRRLPSILNALMDNIISCKDDDLRVDLGASFDTVILSIDEFDGLNTAMSVLLSLVKHDDHRRRATADYHLANFFESTTIDYSRYDEDIIRALFISFNDGDAEVVKAAWTALNEFTKKLKREEMERLVVSTRATLQHVGVPGSSLAGFELPRGINAILPIFLQGLMNGTSEQRTQSALAISDIVDRSSGEALKPFVTQITGPLIRVVSEKSTDVKAAILLTLNNLLEKIPTFLKPFLPQLQRTFAKSLADPSSEVLRSRAAKALGTLITLTPRIDPLIAELVTGSRTSDPGVRHAMLKALYEVISKAGGNMNEASRAAVLGLIDTDSSDADEAMSITNAKLLGALIKNVPSESAANLVKNRVVTDHFTRSSVLALNAVLLESPSSLTDTGSAEDLPIVICEGISSKSTFISDNCILAAGKYMLSTTRKGNFEASRSIFDSLAAAIQPGNPADSRRLALVVVRTVCRHHMELVRPHIALLTQPVFASVRDTVIPIKLAAEAAFMALFNVVEEDSKLFDKFMASQGSELALNTKRSMQDYFKRVVLRLANQARERREAEGGQGGLGLSNDEVEDEREIWSVGKVELGDGVFSEE